MHPYVYNSMIYNTQDMEAAQMSTNRWMYKEDVIHTHTHTLDSEKCINDLEDSEVESTQLNSRK